MVDFAAARAVLRRQEENLTDLKESYDLWTAVGNAVPLEAVVAAVKAKDAEWEVCELVNKAVYATLDYYGIERASDDD